MVSSNVEPVTSGVQQGNVIRLMLFLIFINDLPKTIIISFKMLAGNCLVYHTIHSPNDTNQMQEKLNELGLRVKMPGRLL